MAKEICSKKEKNFVKTKMYRLIEIFGKNIVTLSGKEWAKQRNLFNPLFSIDEHLNSVVDASVEYTNRMIQHRMHGKEIDFSLKRDLHDLALDVVSSVAFGYDISATNDKKLDDLKKQGLPEGVDLTLKESLELSIQALIYNLILGEKILKLLPFQKTKKLVSALKDFDKYMDYFIEKHEIKKNSVLEMMLKSQMNSEEFNTSVIKGNMFIFFFAGHETTAGKFISLI